MNTKCFHAISPAICVTDSFFLFFMNIIALYLALWHFCCVVTLAFKCFMPAHLTKHLRQFRGECKFRRLENCLTKCSKRLCQIHVLHGNLHFTPTDIYSTHTVHGMMVFVPHLPSSSLQNSIEKNIGILEKFITYSYTHICAHIYISKSPVYHKVLLQLCSIWVCVCVCVYFLIILALHMYCNTYILRIIIYKIYLLLFVGM